MTRTTRRYQKGLLGGREMGGRGERIQMGFAVLARVQTLEKRADTGWEGSRL